jgi:hypothetical protein
MEKKIESLTQALRIAGWTAVDSRLRYGPVCHDKLAPSGLTMFAVRDELEMLVGDDGKSTVIDERGWRI